MQFAKNEAQNLLASYEVEEKKQNTSSSIKNSTVQQVASDSVNSSMWASYIENHNNSTSNGTNVNGANNSEIVDLGTKVPVAIVGPMRPRTQLMPEAKDIPDYRKKQSRRDDTRDLNNHRDNNYRDNNYRDNSNHRDNNYRDNSNHRDNSNYRDNNYRERSDHQTPSRSDLNNHRDNNYTNHRDNNNTNRDRRREDSRGPFVTRSGLNSGRRFDTAEKFVAGCFYKDAAGFYAHKDGNLLYDKKTDYFFTPCYSEYYKMEGGMLIEYSRMGLLVKNGRRKRPEDFFGKGGGSSSPSNWNNSGGWNQTSYPK